MASHSLIIIARNRKITTDANVNYCLVTPITLIFVIELFLTRKEGFPVINTNSLYFSRRLDM